MAKEGDGESELKSDSSLISAVTAASGLSAGKRRMVRLSLASISLVTAVGGFVVVRALGSTQTEIRPAVALAEAEAELAEADSYSFTITSENSRGSGTRQRVVEQVDVTGEDWHSRSRSQGWVDELLVVDGTLYWRGGNENASVEDERWAAAPLSQLGNVNVEENLRSILTNSDALTDEALVMTLGPLYLAGLGDRALPIESGEVGLGPFAADPRAMISAFGDVEDAQVVQGAGRGVRIRAVRRAPEVLADAAARTIPDGNFEVVLNGSHRPVSLALTVELGKARHRTHITFGNWGADLSMSAPADAQLDGTPYDD